MELELPVCVISWKLNSSSSMFQTSSDGTYRKCSARGLMRRGNEWDVFGGSCLLFFRVGTKLKCVFIKGNQIPLIVIFWLKYIWVPFIIYKVPFGAWRSSNPRELNVKIRYFLTVSQKLYCVLLPVLEANLQLGDIHLSLRHVSVVFQICKVRWLIM